MNTMVFQVAISHHTRLLIQIFLKLAVNVSNNGCPAIEGRAEGTFHFASIYEDTYN